MSIIDTPFLSGWFSKRNHILNAKLSGLDAHYDNIFRHYILNTSHAHFQIDIILPVAYERGGFTNSIEIQPPLPPISQEQFDTIQGFIHTFNPTSDENLKY